MPFLDAAFAFALTMLVVATLVTQIVRLLRNTARLRREELQKMLDQYFKEEFQPVVTRELNRLQTAIGQKITDGLKKSLPDRASFLGTAQSGLETRVDIPLEELVEHLKRSPYGQKLLQDLGDKALSVFDELGKRYEIVGKAFTESFRKHSRTWSTVIALILALVVNIDSIRIGSAYIQNETLRDRVIAQKDVFVRDYNSLAATIQKEEGKKALTGQDIEQAFKDSKQQFNAVMSSELPVGWSYFPHCYFQADGSTSKDYLDRKSLSGWLLWMLGIVGTAWLAGLGGPFWYDAVAGISRLVQRNRAAARKSES